jgi:hypothetical protein
MSFSLLIEHGDLPLNGTSLATVEGAHKLTQDLMCGIMTPMGTDEAHPDFGSLLEGGFTSDGRYVEGVIGSEDWNRVALVVQSEIQRICNEYQLQQISRNRNDAAVYGKTTLTPSELLVAVDGIQLQQAEDNLLVTVTLKTGNGPIQVNVPVASGTVIGT